MSLGELDLEEAANKARGNWRRFKCFIWFRDAQLADADQWAVIYTHHRESGLLEQSNASVIYQSLNPFTAGHDPDVVFESHSHWAVESIDGMSIRVFRNGQITEAFKTFHGLAVRCAEGQPLNEQEYSNREYEATLENIASAAWGFKGQFALSEGWSALVYEWLSDHRCVEVENCDDQGGYPSESALLEAFQALGFQGTERPRPRSEHGADVRSQEVALESRHIASQSNIRCPRCVSLPGLPFCFWRKPLITITRLFARQLRSVLRRAGFARPPHGQSNAITFLASPTGLQIRAALRDIAIECRLAGPYAPVQFAVPYEFLVACEGSREHAISLSCIPDGKVRISWSDRDVPMSAVYDDSSAKVTESFPSSPESFAAVSPELLPALREAAATAAEKSVHYGLECIQLRGTVGEIIATDFVQLLSQGGLQFPWSDDVLIHGSSVFAAPELSLHEQVELGRTPTHVVIRVGVWTLFLLIEKDNRYPEMRDIIPGADTPGTRCHLEPQDAAFLRRSLRRLPGSGQHSPSVTLDLNGHVTIRARAENDSQTTELVLSRSHAVGEPMRINTNRVFLERMVSLGFDEVLVPRNDAPFLCQDQVGCRTYIWMSRGKDDVLLPSPDCLRIDSAQDCLTN